MKILVTGATGLIGKALCRVLADEGHQIVVLSRRPAQARVTPQAVAYRWEPEAGPPLPEAFAGVEAVVHLAGENVAGGRWTAERKRRIRDSRVLGTRNLVAGMQTMAERPRTLVGSSAVGFYGDRGDEVLTEESAAGQGFLAEVCQEWESEINKAQRLGTRVVTLRTGVVLSTEGGALEKLLPPFKLGVGGRVGDGRQWFPWVHLADIVGLYRYALLQQSLSGVFNGVAPEVVTNEEFVKELAAVLNRPALVPVPAVALRLLFGEMADALLGSLRVTPQAALAAGYQFQFPTLAAALADLLAPSPAPAPLKV